MYELNVSVSYCPIAVIKYLAKQLEEGRVLLVHRFEGTVSPSWRSKHGDRSIFSQEAEREKC